MKTQTNLKLKKGFTVAEMTVTIAIFALVAAMAIGFVTTMSKFTKQNAKDVDLLQLQWMLRIETDKWFSAMDSIDAELCFDKATLEENQLATATVDGHVYAVSFCNSVSAEDSTVFDAVEFTYPNSFGVEGGKVVVNAEHVTDIVFTKYGDTPISVQDQPENSSGVFSFEITLHCKQQSLCCQVFYNRNYN